MNREEYMHLRAVQPEFIVCHYYNERYNPARHTQKLDCQNLIGVLHMTGFMRQVMETVFRHYDMLHNVHELRDKNGQIIKLV